MRRGGGKEHVRYTPETGHVRCTRLCLRCANSGHPMTASQPPRRARSVWVRNRPSELAAASFHDGLPPHPLISDAESHGDVCILVLILRLRTTSFYGITHIVEYKDREGRHALPLIGTKSFV